MSQVRQHPYRKGDWVCVNCSNLNFSFRNICNRCTQERCSHNSQERSGFNTALFVTVNNGDYDVTLSTYLDKGYATPGLLPSIEPLMKIINEQKDSNTFEFEWKCISCSNTNQYYKRQCLECGAARIRKMTA